MAAGIVCDEKLPNGLSRSGAGRMAPLVQVAHFALIVGCWTWGDGPLGRLARRRRRGPEGQRAAGGHPGRNIPMRPGALRAPSISYGSIRQWCGVAWSHGLRPGLRHSTRQPAEARHRHRARRITKRAQDGSSDRICGCPRFRQFSDGLRLVEPADRRTEFERATVHKVPTQVLKDRGVRGEDLLGAGRIGHLITFQPLSGSVDAEHSVFVGQEPERVGEPVASSEVGRGEWVPWGRFLGSSLYGNHITIDDVQNPIAVDSQSVISPSMESFGGEWVFG